MSALSNFPTLPRSTKKFGFFPSRASLHTHTGDVFRSGIFRPVFRLVEMLAVRLRPLQQGRVQMYVLYLAVTLLILLIWKLR